MLTHHRPWRRVVDVELAALGLAAASQGTMNNLTFGDDTFGYYETIAGGSGSGPDLVGASGVQTHMTHTRITDPELLEDRFDARLWRFGLREGSGGREANPGGEGVVRELEALRPLTFTMTELFARATVQLAVGDRMETLGGGGWGA